MGVSVCEPMSVCVCMGAFALACYSEPVATHPPRFSTQPNHRPLQVFGFCVKFSF